MDNEQELEYIQDNGMLSVNLTGQPYGKSYPVRSSCIIQVTNTARVVLLYAIVGI